jgi:lysophospholipase L1-like esterase
MRDLIPCAGRARAAATVVVLFLGVACGGGPTGPPPPPPVPTLTIACPTAAPVESQDDNPVPVSFGGAIASGGQPPVTTTCTAQPGANFPVGTTNVICTATDGRGISAACSFPVVVRPAPRLVGERLVAFGDSITYGIDSLPVPSAAPSWAYPGQLQQRLAARYRMQRIEIVNEGVPGEEASVGVLRFRSVLQTHRPGIVIIMEGTNDLLSGQVGVLRARDALRGMIREAKTDNRRVLLSTILPQRMNGFRVPPRDPFAVWVQPLNDEIRKLAAEENVPLVDMYAVFNADMSLIGIDDVHPTQRGFQVMADTFFEAIRTHFEVPPPALFTRIQ